MHLKRCSKSLVMTDMQIKTIIDATPCPFRAVEFVKKMATPQECEADGGRGSIIRFLGESKRVVPN